MNEQKGLGVSGVEMSGYLGVTPQFYNKVIHGGSPVPLNWCENLSKLFGISLEELEGRWLEDFKTFMHHKEKVSKSKRTARQKAVKLMERLQR